MYVVYDIVSVYVYVYVYVDVYEIHKKPRSDPTGRCFLFNKNGVFVSVLWHCLIWLFFDLVINGPYIGPEYDLKTRMGTIFRVDSESGIRLAPFGAKTAQNGHFQNF